MSGFIQSGRFGMAGGGSLPVAGATLWIDASDTATITSSGGAVSQINDKSGNAYHFTQGTAGNKPTTGTVTLNGLNVLDFDGTDDLLVGPLFSTLINNFTMFMVIAPDAAPTAGTAAFHLGAGGTGYGLSGATNTSKVGLLFGGLLWNSSATAAPSAGGHIISVRRNAGNWDVRYDRASVLTGSSAPNTPTVGSRIGSHDSAGGTLNGGFAEAVYYSSALSNSDWDSVETYLSARWATP